MQIHKAKIEKVTPDENNRFVRYFQFVRAFGERFRYGAQYLIPGVDANPSQYTTRGLSMMVGSDPGQMAVPLVLDRVDKTADEGETRIYSTTDGTNISFHVYVAKDGVRLNGTEYGGLIKIQELTDKLNEFIALYNAHTHGLTPDPSVSAPVFLKTDYENTKVQHG